LVVPFTPHMRSYFNSDTVEFLVHEVILECQADGIKSKWY
jgi:hypothetical protein